MTEFVPHNYQEYAIEYIKEHRIAAIFLSMGLGKTAITLTALNDLLFDSFEVHKVLVIAPLRVARDTWPAELGKWSHLKELRMATVIGSEAERRAALNTPADIYVINRENVQWLVEKSDYHFDFDTVVIDELSSFKNYNAKRFKALMKVRPFIKRIVGLTGTPAGRDISDLFGEIKILDGGKRLGRYITNFRLNYLEPDKCNGQIVYSYRPQVGAEEKIYEKISDISISMDSVDYLDMPERIETVYPVAMSDGEQFIYDDFKRDKVLPLLKGKEITAANAAALCGKCCQLANGAIYDDERNIIEIHKRKLDALEDIIESAVGKPVLVAYWFQHDLTRIQERLDSLGVTYDVIGSSESIRRWNNKELQVGLINPASAGHGLNLQQGSNTIVWFGLTWSLENYQQTNARLWRQGQSESTVVIIHIVTAGTMDEKILDALKNKKRTQDSLLDAVKAEIGGAREEK